MAGRHRISRHPENLPGYRDDPRSMLSRVPAHLSIHPAALEEEIEIQRREMQRIIAENRLVIDDNTVIQRELMAAKDEIHRLGQIIPKLQADKEAHLRELTQKGLKLEAEVRASEPVKIEVKQLRSEIQSLNTMRQELNAQVQGLKQDITRVKAENQQLASMRAEAERMHKELVEARRAVEYEKKANEEQVEQRHLMESSLISMAREIEQLRAELASAGRRPHGFGGGSGYGMFNGSPEMGYPGNGFADGYRGAWVHHNKQGPPRR